MKTAMLFLFLFLPVAAFGQAVSLLGEPVLTPDGKQLKLDEGWKLVEVFTEGRDRVSILYTYQVDSVVEIAPHTFKFWLKIKDYSDTEKDYRLLLYFARCKTREIRTAKIIDHFKKTYKTETLENPSAKYDDVEPTGLDQKAFSTVCKAHDKP